MDKKQVVTLSFATSVAVASVLIFLWGVSGTPTLISLFVIICLSVFVFAGTYARIMYSLVLDEVEAERARLQKVARDYQATPTPPEPDPQASYMREIPRTEGGKQAEPIHMLTSTGSVGAGQYDNVWREMCIRLLVWADMKGDITVGNMVGRGEAFPLSSNREWMTITNCLQDGGYITKRDGASRLVSPYTSFSQVALVIQRGGLLPHPDDYPPQVREIPETVMVKPGWEMSGNV